MTLVGSSAGRVVKLPLLERAGISAVAGGIARGFTKRSFTPHRHREDEAADEGRFEAILWPSGRGRQGCGEARHCRALQWSSGCVCGFHNRVLCLLWHLRAWEGYRIISYYIFKISIH